jgi:hypothetical protein
MQCPIAHILYPAIMPALFFLIALTPVEVLGCRNRGLLAFLIALSSGIAALVFVVTALKGRLRGDAGSERWIISTLILTIPVVALLILA